MKLEDWSPEQVEKAKACKTPEDILALAREEGYELSDEELDGLSGGWDPVQKAVDRLAPACPQCSSRQVSVFPMPLTGVTHCVCHNCGYQWNLTILG